MSIRFTTSIAQSLLKDFDARIAQAEQKGKITTWEKDADGDYTHKAPEWTKKAWFRPKIENNQLTFNILKQKDIPMPSAVYAYYHGHLIETFLNHFDKSFTDAIASALPTIGDAVS